MERACLVVLLLASSLFAQMENSTALHQMKLQLRFANGVCDPSVQVQLIAVSGPVENGRPDDRCEVDFANVPSGTYHVTVSGHGLNQTEETITATNGMTNFEVEVKGPNEEGSAANAEPLVSASALSIPPKARKEFDKSNDQISHQEYQKAIQSLNRAIKIYPGYAAAYNNLGAVYQRLGDRAQERDAIQKAISLDGHLAAAYLNLGRMDIADNNFPAGEDALSKAASNNPSDPMALVLLSYCQLRDRRFDDAILTSHKAHPLQGQHSSVHLIAAKAFEQERNAAGAIGELDLFLKEEPAGERADQARKDLSALRTVHP